MPAPSPLRFLVDSDDDGGSGREEVSACAATELLWEELLADVLDVRAQAFPWVSEGFCYRAVMNGMVSCSPLSATAALLCVCCPTASNRSGSEA